MENITSLFNTPRGRTPRTATETMKALELNAVPDRIDIVATYLARLVRRGQFRRIQKEGKWFFCKIPSSE
jgi:hypothetical protein